MIGSPFDDKIAFRALTTDGNVPPGFPEELAALGPAVVGKRLREFLAGRAAARAAVSALQGSSAGPIGRGRRGEPLWPAGLVGSITHTRGLALAAVGWREDTVGLGIDIEAKDRKVSLEVARLVCLPQEQAWVEAGEDPGLRLKMLFSAKESVFKALYPLESVYLSFKDAELHWRDAEQVFRARLRLDAAVWFPRGSSIDVGCRTDGDFILTYVRLPALASCRAMVSLCS